MGSGRLFIVSGPSGAGKSSICEKLYEDGSFKPSVSMTTRARRGKEVHGISYYYVSDEDFQHTIDNGGFLEHAEIYGHRYGTPKKPVLENLALGHDVILEIEMQGAAQAKAAYPDAITVFVLPPSMKALRDRLIKRGTDDEGQIARRIREALGEIHRIREYDYYIINDDIEASAEELRAIAAGGGSRVPEDVGGIIERYEEEVRNAALSGN